MSSRPGRATLGHLGSADKSLPASLRTPDALIADAEIDSKSQSAIFIRRKGIIGLLLIRIRGKIQPRIEWPIDYPAARRYSQEVMY